MPIPTINLGEHSSASRAGAPSLRLVESAALVDASRLRRGTAHALDLVFLLGLSFAFSQLLAVVFLQFHLPEVNEFGRQGLRVAQSGYEYGHTWLFWGSFLFFNFLYFVALPFWTETTLGLGLLGCKIIKNEAGKVSWDALFFRWLGLGMQYLTLGFLALLGGRGPMVQDRISKTVVVTNSHD